MDDNNVPQLVEQLVLVPWGHHVQIIDKCKGDPDKFPSDYMFELTTVESQVLRSKISTLERGSKGHYSKFNYKVFTEKVLYMLATILKSKRAVSAPITIIEMFAKVRGLKRELVELHKEDDKRKQEISSILVMTWR